MLCIMSVPTFCTFHVFMAMLSCSAIEAWCAFIAMICMFTLGAIAFVGFDKWFDSKLK